MASRTRKPSGSWSSECSVSFGRGGAGQRARGRAYPRPAGLSVRPATGWRSTSFSSPEWRWTLGAATNRAAVTTRQTVHSFIPESLTAWLTRYSPAVLSLRNHHAMRPGLDHRHLRGGRPRRTVRIGGQRIVRAATRSQELTVVATMAAIVAVQGGRGREVRPAGICLVRRGGRGSGRRCLPRHRRPAHPRREPTHTLTRCWRRARTVVTSSC